MTLILTKLTLGKKLKDLQLAKFYNVSIAYLLGLSDADRHLNAAYANLGLSDKTIDLLKEWKINLCLLNELIEHEDFDDFMANIEIYIDELASIQINSINSITELASV